MLNKLTSIAHQIQGTNEFDFNELDHPEQLHHIKQDLSGEDLKDFIKIIKIYEKKFGKIPNNINRLD